MKHFGRIFYIEVHMYNICYNIFMINAEITTILYIGLLRFVLINLSFNKLNKIR